MKRKQLKIEDIQAALLEIQAALPADSIIIKYEVSVTTKKKPGNPDVGYDTQTIISSSSVTKKDTSSR